MTEGIIQKVFRKYKDEHFEEDLSEGTILGISKEIIKNIEQELIQEIRERCRIGTRYPLLQQLEEELIGGTKE